MKTMDYYVIVGILTEIEVIFAVLLLLAGRCYEAEFCTTLLSLRYSFEWYPFLQK